MNAPKNDFGCLDANLQLPLFRGDAVCGFIKKCRNIFKIVPAFFLLILIACQSAGTTTHSDESALVTLFAEIPIEVSAEIADSDAERTQGLMHRETLAASAGMLFVFDDEDMRFFWMKNTPLSLDIIFISADKKIVSIAENTTPFSEAPISSEFPAKFVLEVNAGFSATQGLAVDQSVEFTLP